MKPGQTCGRRREARTHLQKEQRVKSKGLSHRDADNAITEEQPGHRQPITLQLGSTKSLGTIQHVARWLGRVGEQVKTWFNLSKADVEH